MKLILMTTLIGLCHFSLAGSGKEKTKRHVSLIHSRKVMDYLLENSDEIVDTILRGGPGSTELLAQVSGVTLGSTTQAWFRCSKQFGVSRGSFADNIGSYVAYKNVLETCAMSCYMEESRMVSNGMFDPAMTALVMVMAYGDDRDIHYYSKGLVNHCNRLFPPSKPQTCRSGAYLDCFVKGFRRANIYMPGPILEAFTNPFVMEITY